MEFGPVFYITFLSVMALFHAHNLRPFTLNPRTKPRLREQALDALAASDRDTLPKFYETDRIKDEKRLEYLRLYARFIGTISAHDLREIIIFLRLARRKLHTKLTPQKLTEDQAAVYAEFAEAWKDVPEPSDEKRGQADKRWYSFMRVALHAMTNLDESDKILYVVRERGIYNLREVKDMVNALNLVPSSALSEGML